MFMGLKINDLQDGARPQRVAIRSQCVRTNTRTLYLDNCGGRNRPAAKRRKNAAHSFP
jgi:hypothetical protein